MTRFTARSSSRESGVRSLDAEARQREGGSAVRGPESEAPGSESTSLAPQREYRAGDPASLAPASLEQPPASYTLPAASSDAVPPCRPPVPAPAAVAPAVSRGRPAASNDASAAHQPRPAGVATLAPDGANTVLFAGHSDTVRLQVERLCGHIGFVMSAADGPAETLAALEEGHHPVCVLEIGGNGGGAPIVQAIRSQHPRTMIIAVADPDNPDATAEAVRAGVFDVLSRPVQAAEFAVLVANAHEHLAFVAAQRDVAALESAPYGVFGVSHAMRDVMHTVERAAPSRCGVIICGERGTGREMVARAIHAHGLRPHAPFVKVDCALPTPQDVEQELFGPRPPRRGDGDPARRHLEQLTPSGRVFDAIGGTLFLENAASMPDRVQVRLVRLLRDREAIVPDRRDPIDVDVRPIAALEPSSTAFVEDDRIRPDLYEQLSVVRIDLPALRHRREDIPLLAIHFLKEICRANGSQPKTLSRAALALLGALSWRGNARELRALVERLVLLVPHGIIRIEDILAHVRLDTSLAPVGSAATLREARLRFEREYIQAVLQQHHGRMGEAARVLGIQRTNLYRKVRSLNLGGVQRRQRRG